MIGALILGLMPSFLQVFIRRLLGQKIGRRSKIRFGTILKSSSVNIGNGVIIGPFCYIKSENLEIGDNSQIKPLSIISTRNIKLGKYVHIAPMSTISSEFTENSMIEAGDHARIFPFSWLDTGEGIKIGKQTSVGTYSSIYTHGVWANYLQGGPVVFGPVNIKDNVWIPVKVTILPNVEIGSNTIISANSLVNKSFANNLLIGGTPAKIIRENVNVELSPEEKNKRINEILKTFAKYVEYKRKLKSELHDSCLLFSNSKIIVDKFDDLNQNDLLVILNEDTRESNISALVSKGISVLHYRKMVIYIAGKNRLWKEFATYLRRYGIRLYTEK